jgi:RNA polymerase sigma factor (sigma-70 family)
MSAGDSAHHREHLLFQRLIGFADAVSSFVSARIPARLGATLSPEDVLQEVWITVFRKPDFALAADDEALMAWLKSLANRKLLDAIRLARRGKRGANRVVQQSVIQPDSAWSFVDVLTAGAGPQRTPSRESATGEAASYVTSAIDALDDDQRVAVRMHHIEGRSLSDVAAAMGKSVRAVNGLVFRGVRELRKQLGRAGRFFTDSGPLDAVRADRETRDPAPRAGPS